uniref:Dihydrolipoamide acetyltransferase, putative n=1 Tax=Chlorobium chlorochromatii (strain CaD3) TaxID=340177 RepID=Q3AR16_CHLCH
MAKDHYFTWQLSAEISAKIRYQEYGHEHHGKTPILFLHGYGAMLEHWDLNIPHFAEQHKMYAMDLIGFGKSQKPNVRYSLELFAQQIQTFLLYKKLESVIIVGHSMGAASSLYFAHHQPEPIKALVMANPSGLFADTMDGVASMFFGLVASPVIGDVLFTAFANPMGVSQSLTPTYYNQNKVDDKLIRQFTQPLHDVGAQYSYMSPSKRPLDFRLDHLPKPCNYQGPAYLVWGADDMALPPQKIIPEFQQLIPHAGAFIIPKAAHCIHHDAHEAFNQRLAFILQELEG